MKRFLHVNWLFALLGLIVLAIPPLTRSPYYLSIGVFIALHAMVALGLGLLLGYAGQVSLGHAAFYGLGAYGSAILTVHYHWNPWLALPTAALITAALAYIIGRPTLKLHGHYLAMATLGLGIIVRILFNEGGEFTGGPSGLPGIPYLQIGNLVISDDLRMYLLVWPVLGLLVLLSRNLLNSRLGRCLRAIHDSEIAAGSCAIDTGRAKVMVFVFSAVCASVAGSLYAHYIKFVNPEPFGFAFSIELVVMVIVGGAGTLLGPIIGTAALTLITQVLVAVGAHYPVVKDLDVVIFGLLLVAILILRRQKARR
ncbi:MAG: branched-chain amino acid ABC transporter permease [Armatimonadetes bacterium]|nr:branched-chain amino acid ABC transporter permease [Armatimonadota bacterium]